MSQFRKDPEAVLDFAVDWTRWLSPAETITSHTITTEVGITKDSSSEADGVVTIWLSGGTAGQTYTVECLVVTSAGRTDERSFNVAVGDR